MFVRKWLRPTCNLVGSLIPWGSTRTWFDKRFVLKHYSIPNFEYYYRVYSTIVLDGKKVLEFWKYSCLTLNKRTSLWFLVARVDKTSMRNDLYERYIRDAQFFQIWKTSAIFGTITVTLSIQDQIPGKVSLEELLIPLVITNAVLFLTKSNLFWKDSLKAWS